MKKYLVLFLFLLSLGSCLDHFFAPLIITGAVTNVDKEGAVFHAKITDLGNNDIAEFGFVWDTIPDPKVEHAEKYIFHNRAQVGNYEAKISTCLITLKTYYVRAFIRSGNVITYGEETSFISQGGKLPEITSISPILGNLADTLVIAGKYFSARGYAVKINEIETEIIKSNQDSIYIRIPSSLTRKNSAISVTNLNQTITAKDSFTLITPVISSFDAKTGTYGEAVTITGKNFMENPSSVHVYFDKILTTHQIINDQTIRAIVPNELNKANCTISVGMNNQTTESAEKYSLSPVEVTDFSPKTAFTGGTITITGNNFSPIAGNNRVYIGGVLARTNSVSKNSLTVTLSLQYTGVYESRNATVKVDVGGNISAFNDKLLINDKWFRRANAPSELYTVSSVCSTCDPSYDNYNANCFTIGKTAYIGLHNKKEFWAYDTDKNSWRKLKDFPGTPRMYGTGFVYGNKIYFGTGMTSKQIPMNDWWEYDISTNSWVEKNNFPISTYKSVGFSNDDGCFMTNGYIYNKTPEYITYSLQALKYDPENDSWSNLSIGSWVSNNNSGMNFWTPCKSIGNEVYVNLGIQDQYRYTDRMYILNTRTNTMKNIADYPLNLYQNVISFYINGKVYIRKKETEGYSYPSFYYNDGIKSNWISAETTIYTSLWNGIAFEAGNLGFAGLGTANHLYEFDPSR